MIAAFTIVVPASANLKKAFEALEVHNYFLARELFLKNTKRDPEVAWYGMSVISGRDNNPFHDLDSAYIFIMRSDAAFTLADEKRRKKIQARYGVDGASIEAQKDHVFERAWEKAVALNSIEGYDRYLQFYKDSPRTGEAMQRRDQLAFQQARELNTAAAFEAFIAKYPHSHEVYEARSRLQEAIYRESTKAGTIEAYLQFLKDHPESPYVEDAEDRIFQLSTPDRSVEEYYAFIKKYPDNHKVEQAWRNIYDIHTRDLSVNAITRFLTEFPDYPYVAELADDYKTASLELIPFRQDTLWGFIDTDGIERIPAIYDWVESFKGAQAVVSRGGKVGTVNRSGREVVPVKYDEILEQSDGTSVVELDGRTGVVDRRGELVIPLKFSDIGEFSQKLAYAANDSLYGYVNDRGEVEIPFQFNSAGTFRNGLAVIETDEGFGVIDTKGNIVVPPLYDWIEGFENEVSRIRKDDVFGLISPFGDMLMPLEYKHIGPFKEGLALVVQGRKAGYVNMSGETVIPFEYEAGEGTANWGDLINGLAEVQQNGKRCMIDTSRKKILQCQYADIGLPTGALIPFRKRTKWGYADRNGTILFDNRYDQAWEMIDGIARVGSGEIFGAIDSTGREVVPLRFSNVADVKWDHVVVTDAQGSGLFDRGGNEILPAINQSVAMERKGIARIEQNDRFAYLRLIDRKYIWKEEGFDGEDGGSAE